MINQNLKEILVDAKEKGYALGAFNILNDLTARSVIRAAEDMDLPVIIQTSVSTVKKFGTIPISKMLTSLKSYAKVPVFIHLDHCTDPVLAKECVDAGWDSVMIDASHKPLEENIKISKEIKDYAEKKGVFVEGELGIIKGVEDNVVADTSVLANVEDSMKFITETGVDLFAPAIGTAHGVYSGVPVINFDLVKDLCQLTDCPIVVHGGTGLADEVFTKLVGLGAVKINVSTAIKKAYLNSCRTYMTENPDLSNPLKLDEYMEQAVYEVVKRHMTVFALKND